MFGVILKAANSSFQKGITFCRSIYVKKVMKLLAFIFEQPSYTRNPSFKRGHSKGVGLSGLRRLICALLFTCDTVIISRDHAHKCMISLHICKFDLQFYLVGNIFFPSVSG